MFGATFNNSYGNRRHLKLHLDKNILLIIFACIVSHGLLLINEAFIGIYYWNGLPQNVNHLGLLKPLRATHPEININLCRQLTLCRSIGRQTSFCTTFLFAGAVISIKKNIINIDIFFRHVVPIKVVFRAFSV